MSEAEDWLRYAREDLTLARLAFEHDQPPRIVAFHAQQAAEKALKATLISEGVTPLETHDLERLAELLPEDSSVGRVQADLSALTEAAARARYPDTALEVTHERAKSSLADAEAILQAAEEDVWRSSS